MAEIKHIGSLDGLRGFAASMVVFKHVEAIFPTLGPLPAFKLGEQGVAIFFALSGFLMAYLYASKTLDRAAAGDYLVHRFARIYPVYAFAVLFWAALSQIPDLHYVRELSGLGDLLRHLLLIGSRGVFWSIPPEIQFYIFFLLLWRCFADPRNNQTLIAAIVVLLAIDAMFGFPGPGILLFSKLPYFLFGAVAGRLHALYPIRNAPNGIGVAAWLMLGTILVSRAWGIVTLENFWGMHTALAAAALVYLVACENRLTVWFFASKPLRFAGAISFSLYLLHLPIMFLVNRLLEGWLPRLVVVPLSLIVAFAVAWVSYRLIENPSRRYLTTLWKNRGTSFVAAKAS